MALSQFEKDVITAAIRYVQKAQAHAEIQDGTVDFSELKDAVDCYLYHKEPARE